VKNRRKSSRRDRPVSFEFRDLPLTVHDLPGTAQKFSLTGFVGMCLLALGISSEMYRRFNPLRVEAVCNN
jgi:hypothetical protein